MRLLVAICFLFIAAQLPAVDNVIHPVTEDLPAEPLMTMSEIDASLNTLNHIVAGTERTLAAQRDIQQQLSRYRQLKSEYLQDPQNRSLVIRLVKAAHKLNESIKAQYLNDALDGEFLRELTFFSKIAAKKSLPKP